MPSRDCRERTRGQVGKHVLQKGSIGCGFPRYCRPGLISETGPVNGNGGEVCRKALLEGPHLSPRRDGAERRQQQGSRSFSQAVKSNSNRFALPTPGDATACHTVLPSIVP